jgi:hypothetical protein
VLNQIELFKGIDIKADDQVIVLDTQGSQCLINMWIGWIYGSVGSIDIQRIGVDDIEHFLKLIEQYPTNSINTKLLEPMIIKYLLSHDDYLDKNQWLIDFCQRNQMKHMYVYIHNHMIK